MNSESSPPPFFEPHRNPRHDPHLNQPAWVDLRRYDPGTCPRGRSRLTVLGWWFVQAIAFPLSHHSAHGFRCALLRLFGSTIGQGVHIRPTARFTYPWKVTIDDHAWVGDDVVFYSIDAIWIGQHSVISQQTYLCTASHDIQDPRFGLVTGAIAIGNGAWVASRCFVGPGVRIGANTVVGVNSTVLQDLPPGQVCFGTPCRVRSPRLPQP
ncbi:WcaF family extracellular polysaccharide biosynthesis acetyltransferase [Prochlorothrix hollandica]|uniref:WcaF family extracellular polysaccharide biosynthesis acetyltransferase n=1 Tax=Prochlorothrix hollandica TaxID=1223 RepID=UPI0011D2884D|nr:WcaF family extracellular polysaccharide biosynthesis acetyltransferase [Prochlorothrix hollandica]